MTPKLKTKVIPIKMADLGAMEFSSTPMKLPKNITGAAMITKWKLILLLPGCLRVDKISYMSLPKVLISANNAVWMTASCTSSPKNIKVAGRMAEVPPIPPRVAVNMITASRNNPMNAMVVNSKCQLSWKVKEQAYYLFFSEK